MSEEQIKAEMATRNGYSMTSWILGIIAILMNITNTAGATAGYLAILGIIFGGIGLYKIEEAHGKPSFTILCLIINIIAIIPYIF